MTKVLIVDDDPFTAEHLSTRLDFLGYETQRIPDAFVLMQRFDEVSQFDVVVLDLMMRKPPAINVEADEETGEAIYKLIRAKYPAVKILVLTGKDQSELVITPREDGNELVLKPVRADISDVIEALDALTV